MKKQDHHSVPMEHAPADHYKKLLIMAVLSYIAMYAFMYSMVDRLENVVPNINQFYMAGVMTAPMVLIELAVMGGMYKNKKLNAVIMLASTVLLIGFYLGIREQVGVTDKQFLKSMIPHHAGAILMSEKTALRDPEVRELQQSIIKSQEAEIAFMKRKLEEMEKSKQ